MTTETWNSPLFFDLDKVESIAEEEAAITLDYSLPIIVPEDSELEMDNRLEVHEPKPVAQPFQMPSRVEKSRAQKSSSSSFSPWLWLVGALGLLLVLMLLVDAYHFIEQQYAESFLMGTVFLGLIFTIGTASLLLSWQAYRKIQTLRTVSALQQEGRQLMATDGYGNASHYINKIADFYAQHPDVKTRLEHFYLALNDTHHDREVCHLFSNFVMKEMDQQAYQIVIQRSKETALMVMISQIALLDTVLTLWRNIRMIRDVATLYGGKPGFLGSLSLITSVLQNLIYADVSEMVAESVAEILGGSMLSVMSAQVAQGLGSGVMTARVGLHAIQACRPLPFPEEEKPRLRDIRREIISSLKEAFKTKESSSVTSSN